MLHQDMCIYQDSWDKARLGQPRSGERMQPTAQAVGKPGNRQAPAGRKIADFNLGQGCGWVAFAELAAGNLSSCSAASSALSASEVLAPAFSSRRLLRRLRIVDDNFLRSRRRRRRCCLQIVNLSAQACQFAFFGGGQSFHSLS